jgi:hypothetical protein
MRNPQKDAIKNIRGLPKAYGTETRFQDGAWQTFVYTWCIECGKRHEVHWNTGGADPAFVDKKMRGLGWHFDAHKPKNCVCPECIQGPARAGPVTGKVTEEPNDMKNTTPPNSTDNNPSGYSPPTHAGDTAITSMVATQIGKTDVPPPRTLTAHERTKVRQLLDGHFDELKGQYLEGYDDKRIGEECNVPWALVTQIRELAYGPIKEDPEKVAFRAEAKALREEFLKMAKSAEEAVDKMHAQFKAIEGRLINIEAKARKL